MSDKYNKMNLIRTDLVDTATDVFWEDVSQLTKEAATRPLLVLVKTYAPGSADGSQLQKMLDACGLKQEQYHIIQMSEDEKASWPGLREQLDPKVIFLIGVMPAQLGISALFQAHVANNFNDRIWLPTLSLAELEQQPAIKKQLWTGGMKPVFVDRKELGIGN